MPPQINEIEDSAALATAARMQCTSIQVPAIGLVDTVFVGPGAMHTCAVLQFGCCLLLLSSMILPCNRPCMLTVRQQAGYMSLVQCTALHASKTAYFGVCCCT